MNHSLVLKVGDFLFRWRGYFPLILLIVGWKALFLPEYLENISQALEDLFEISCVFLSLLGILVRFLIAGYTPEGTSGRNTKAQKAEVLNTKGFYSIIRHPLYILANFPTFLGYILFTQVWWLILLGIPLFFLYYYFIIKAEDHFLEEKFGDEWRSWAKKTPAFYPKFHLWVPFEGPFNLKKALKNINSTLFITVNIFALIDICKDLINEGELDYTWFFISLFSLAFYLGLKIYLKRNYISTRVKTP